MKTLLDLQEVIENEPILVEKMMDAFKNQLVVGGSNSPDIRSSICILFKFFKTINQKHLIDCESFKKMKKFN